MSVKAKFYVAETHKYASQQQAGWAAPAPMGKVILRPVSRGEDNKEWASATPSGLFEMTVRGEAYPWFEERLGKEVSISITDA